jgi:hypothetical protein
VPGEAIPQRHIRLPKHCYDLFGTMSLLHIESFPAQEAGWILSYFLDQFSGRGPLADSREKSPRITRNQVLGNRLRVRFPCPPLQKR